MTKKIETTDYSYNNYLIQFEDGLILSVGINTARVADKNDHGAIRTRIKERLETMEFSVIEKNLQERPNL